MKKLSDVVLKNPKGSQNKSEDNKSGKKIKVRFSGQSKRKRIILICAAVLIVLIAIFLIWFFLKGNFSSNSINKVGKPTDQITPRKFFSPLTGRETTEEKTKRTVTAVMIENSPEARPQSGLKDAGVVFEAVAEGGITRFIALYQEAEPSLIGPVRSARAYFLEWAAAFDPAVAHVGGSGDALAMIHSGNYGVDLDQFYNAGAYWRAKDRAAPHNVYTDFQHLSDLEQKKGKTSSQFDSWPRTDGKASGTPNATSINLEPSSGQFAVHYDYDAATNTYKRSQGGKPHLDREQGQIAPDVVIALRVNQTLASDDLHSNIQTTGSGDVYVFQNGAVIQGTWRKNSAKEQIHFYDQVGKEIELNHGQVWITAVAQGRKISWQ